MSDKVTLGEIVQIEYVRRVVGYLYKNLDDRLVISPSSEIEDGTKLKVVLKKDIVEVASFAVHQPQKQEEEKQPGEMGKLIQFPTNSDGGEVIS